MRTFEPFGDKQSVTEEMNLTLVPYGCTNLRITYFPKAGKKIELKNMENLEGELNINDYKPN